MISFLLNDSQIKITDEKADQTLLNYLREKQTLTGTKEGCASGDCGACTVVVAEPNDDNDKLSYRAINSCVTFMSAVHAKQVITVEGLADSKTLHPVQQAMIDEHGSQCGFCTPGFVMSMFALYHQDLPADRESIDIALSGNLCRCTGYRPIIAAAKSACQHRQPDKFDTAEKRILSQLAECQKETSGIPGLYLPENRQQLAELKAKHPDARVFAGSTDLALEVTQQYKSLPQLISLSGVAELNQIQALEEGLSIGAALPFSDCEALLLKHFPELTELVMRFASRPIRNQASLGGNVANASPIGDMPPALIALEASIITDNGIRTRKHSAADFFTGYRQTQLAEDEWVASIFIPYASEQRIAAYKISKRFEDDISAVCAVFKLETDEQGQITHFCSGFGGVAATPASCKPLDSYLLNKDWRDKGVQEHASNLLAQHFQPIDDVRATADYRRKMLANLFKRFWLETQHATIETRVVNYA